MNFSRALLVPMVLLAAACDRQDARPLIAPDEAAYQRTKGSVRVFVQRDTSNARPPAAPKFATATTGTRVNLVRESDTTFIESSGTTDAAGNILLTGIEPGTYLLKAAFRDSSTMTPPLGVRVIVFAGDTALAETVRIRLSTRISGTIRTDFTDQTRLTSRRHAGVIVTLQRETAAGNGNWVTQRTDTTNAAGIYEFFVSPGPERVRIQYNSVDIADFKDSTTLGGTAPPYTRKVESAIISGIDPGADRTSDATFSYPTRITGRIFRDRDADGVRDSALVFPAVGAQRARGTKEGTVVGDSIRLQLMDSTASRVITSTALLITTTGSHVPVTDSIGFNIANQTYTFSSVAPGKYVLRMDKLTSRFGSNPLEFPNGPQYDVLVVYSATGATSATCRKRGTTDTFGSCDFGLVTGQ